MKRRPLYLSISAVTMVVGIVWRFVPVGLPPFLYKYGGSVLWAAMIYWVLAAVAPRSRPARLALAAAAIATAVEFFKLVHSPGLDAFRLTIVGKVVFGRFFYWSDFLAYYLAIALAAAVDARGVRPAYNSSGMFTRNDR